MATVIPDIFEYDIGTHFVADIQNIVNSEDAVPFDELALASEKLIIFILPDETEKEFAATFVTDGSDGLLEYVTSERTDLVKVTDDLFEFWEYYAWIKYPTGERRTSTVKFRLYKGRASLAGS